MSLRIRNAWPHIVLASVLAITGAGCSDSASEAQGGSPPAETVKADGAAPENDAIPCALNGATSMQTVCKHTVIGNGATTQLLLEGPEGDFRRFTILTDGRGLEPSDGAEPAAIKLLDSGKIEVAVGDDIFVFPAKVKPSVVDALPAQRGQTSSEPAAPFAPQ